MSAYIAVDLAKLPAPNVVEALDFETILTALKADAIARDATLAEALELESEPVLKLLEIAAYRELVLRQRINDAARANMLAYAMGGDLENLAALFGVSRAVIQAGDDDANPPVPEILEDDDRLRTRIQLSLEGQTTAGPVGAYQYFGLSADANVKDVSVTSPAPGQVVITVLSRDGTGVPSPELLDIVVAALGDDVRPLTDQVLVVPANVQIFTVQATLTLFDGPDSQLVVDAAEAAVETYVEAHHRLGHDITIAGLHAALFQSGVQNVDLTLPAADLVIGAGTAAHCEGIALAFGGHDV